MSEALRSFDTHQHIMATELVVRREGLVGDDRLYAECRRIWDRLCMAFFLSFFLLRLAEAAMLGGNP